MSSSGLPNAALRLAGRCFEDSAEREAFLEALRVPRPYAPAIVRMTRDEPLESLRCRARPSWLPANAELLETGERPGATDAHDRGELYVLDPSSVFAASLFTHLDRPEVVCDLCASPGGKSIIAWRELAPARLLANEVIGKRLGAIVSNFERCRIDPAAIYQRDPSVWSAEAARCADLLIVDAPCSGQSLLARGKKVPGGFHPSTINLNVNRQRRILGNAASIVAPQGHLAYMTCTFSEKENEGNLRWFLKRHPGFAPVEVPALEAYRSHLTDLPCYRLWPHRGEGAGAFTALLRHETPGQIGQLPRLPPVWSSTSWTH